jgi:hypothetical protein
LILFGCQTINLVYLGEVRPYESRKQLREAYFNECMIFVLLYHLTLFTKETIDKEELRQKGGLSLIIFTVILVLVNGVLISVPGINRSILQCKRRHILKKYTQLQEAKQASI